MPENNTQKISTTAKDYVEDRTGYRFVPSLEKLAEILKGYNIYRWAGIDVGSL